MIESILATAGILAFIVVLVALYVIAWYNSEHF